MRRKGSILIFGILAILLSVSCDKQEAMEGRIFEQFFIRTEGVELPVLVSGNESSRSAVIFLHGGPGGSAIQARQSDGLRALEQNFKMVYYDQRGSGTGQGNVDPATITLEQFSRDLGIIVDYVAQRQDIDNIFLMGQSFGGGLASYYLSETLDGRIRAFIAVSPGFDLVKGLQLSRQWAIDLANERIAEGRDEDNWQQVLDFYDRNVTIDNDNFFEHLVIIQRAGGVVFNQNASITELNMENLIDETVDINFRFVLEHLTLDGINIFESLQLDDELSEIVIPVLLLWGNEDGLLPEELSTDFLDNLGTPPLFVRYRRFNDSAHELFSEAFPQITNEIRNFIRFFE